LKSEKYRSAKKRVNERVLRYENLSIFSATMKQFDLTKRVCFSKEGKFLLVNHEKFAGFF